MTANELLVAAIKGDLSQIRECLNADVDPNAVDSQVGNSALYNATFCDQVDAIRALLKGGANPNLRLNYRSPVDHRQERQVVALMYALSVEAAKTLIDAGADVNAADADGRTPLIRAARRGNPDVVRVLLDAGADAGHTMKNGQSASDVAIATSARYKTWDVGPNSALIAEKVGRLERIQAMLVNQ